MHPLCRAERQPADAAGALRPWPEPHCICCQLVQRSPSFVEAVPRRTVRVGTALLRILLQMDTAARFSSLITSPTYLQAARGLCRARHRRERPPGASVQAQRQSPDARRAYDRAPPSLRCPTLESWAWRAEPSPFTRSVRLALLRVLDVPCRMAPRARWCPPDGGRASRCACRTPGSLRSARVESSYRNARSDREAMLGLRRVISNQPSAAKNSSCEMVFRVRPRSRGVAVDRCSFRRHLVPGEGSNEVLLAGELDEVGVEVDVREGKGSRLPRTRRSPWSRESDCEVHVSSALPAMSSASTRSANSFSDARVVQHPVTGMCMCSSSTRASSHRAPGVRRDRSQRPRTTPVLR